MFIFKKILFGAQADKAGNGSEAAQDRPSLPVFLKPVTVAIMNQKGGCGKTTTVVNLSAALALRGYRILVVDMDPQAHASLGFGIRLEEFHRSIYDFLVNPDVSFGDVMRTSQTSRLDVLPASMKLAGAQLELANMPRGETVLKQRLRPEEKNYDFILVDCPPTLNLLTLNALSYARKVLVPVQTHYYALDGMKELFRTIEAVRLRFNPHLEILGILATLFDKRANIAVQILDALREHFQERMLGTVIHSSVKLIEAPMVHEPVISHAPHSSATADYNRLASEVLELVRKEN